MSKCILVFIFLVAGSCSFSQSLTGGKEELKTYRLEKQLSDSDFNYDLLKGLIDNSAFLRYKNIKDYFEPVDGEYRYYQFIATYKGMSYTGETKTFNDLLIVKTNAEGIILDAFQYTLEWAEPPLGYDLYRSSTKEEIILKNKLNITSLEFKNPHDQRPLKENGVMEGIELNRSKE